MLPTPDPRRTFRQAAEFFVQTSGLVRPEQWQLAGLGEWSVRDLVGHTSRAMLTVETYLDQPAEAETAATPVDYFVNALASAAADPRQVAQRGREAGAALGPDPHQRIAELVAGVMTRVEHADPAQLLTTPFGGMRLASYLPTRTFELTVHTLDLASALDLELIPPDEAAAESLALAAGLALRTGRAAEVLLSLTGRGPLPTSFSVLRTPSADT
jgi:uncharacterized protein (TIGR03083 family)